MGVIFLLNLVVLILFIIIFLVILFTKFSEISNRSILLYVFVEEGEKILFSSPSKEKRIGKIISLEDGKCVFQIEDTTLISEIGMKNIVFLDEEGRDITSSVEVRKENEVIEMRIG